MLKVVDNKLNTVVSLNRNCLLLAKEFHV